MWLFAFLVRAVRENPPWRLNCGKTGGRLYTGKDYLRLAKNETEARTRYKQLLEEYARGKEHVIYVATEKDQLDLLPKNTVRILATADLETIKTRFAARMGGNLPAPVARMLEQKHGSFDDCGL